MAPQRSKVQTRGDKDEFEVRMNLWIRTETACMNQQSNIKGRAGFPQARVAADSMSDANPGAFRKVMTWKILRVSLCVISLKNHIF